MLLEEIYFLCHRQPQPAVELLLKIRSGLLVMYDNVRIPQYVWGVTTTEEGNVIIYLNHLTADHFVLNRIIINFRLSFGIFLPHPIIFP